MMMTNRMVKFLNFAHYTLIYVWKLHANKNKLKIFLTNLNGKYVVLFLLRFLKCPTKNSFRVICIGKPKTVVLDYIWTMFNSAVTKAPLSQQIKTKLDSINFYIWHMEYKTVLGRDSLFLHEGKIKFKAHCDAHIPC